MSDSLTFRLLRYIKAAAETLNFTRAAEQVFVAQSSLSSQIGKFEDTVELPVKVHMRADRRPFVGQADAMESH